MKVTLTWLKQYVDFDWSPEELSERLTMLGLEVEGVHKMGGEFEGIVVGQVLSKDKVEGSDKLSVNRVHDGTTERTIICGAPNHKPGDKVALILPGFSLPMKPGDKEPFVIKERKVFGVVSQGMMCSKNELGLGEDHDGIIILPADAKVGQSFAEHLGRAGSDVVYDLEVTPNRPDLNSVIGIAREIAAATGNPLKMPVISSQYSAVSDDIAKFVAVNLQEPELCPRYTARVVRGVKVGPSPDWLRQTLEKVGLRSINNVVDVTNYVMLETGQPLHAFDYHLIAKDSGGKPTIVVRRATGDEKFTTLDGQERRLTGDMLLIADEQKGIALAGVMGGSNTEIQDDTEDVLIESAYFLPTNIRRTSKSLGLRSESSYRFERGCDIALADYASQRAVQLILETAGGTLVPGIVDAWPKPVQGKVITLRHSAVEALLGVEIPADKQSQMLQSLGLGIHEAAGSGQTSYRVPSFRVDLKREVDLIEEIARLHGVDKIPSTPPRGALGSHAFDAVYDHLSSVRRLLTGLGLDEAQGQTLISQADVRNVSAEKIVALANPLSSDMDVLRPSLISGLLAILHHNINHKNGDLAIFEVGRVFLRAAGGGTSATEERRVAVVVTGQRNPGFWEGDGRDARFDAADLKGIVEALIESFGLRGVSYNRVEAPGDCFIESATIALGGKLALGELGQLHPKLARHLDLRDPVFIAELRLDQLLARANDSKSFKALPQFPSIRRDVAMIVPETVTHTAVMDAVRKSKPANLENVELFDVFRGKHVPEGQKSLAYAFTYRGSEKTLTDAEVNAAHNKVVETFRQQLKAVVRE